MGFVSKYFDELTTRELYEILKARAEIFVVEQKCMYNDMDDKDYDSLHFFYEDGGRVTAYLRSFFIEPNVVKMGRVLTLHHGTGMGGRLLKEGITQIREKQHPERIVIHAQCYAVGFYERAGFAVCSEPFSEEGMPHVRMELEL
ncbi:MAG: GNAT family N-acetyltransferase [Eubacterium sp.]|nr:GNAT family N-acetyltransferase [Eubacterium sp.]